MLQTILVLAAEEGPEPSKTLFYIAGGLLVLWALVVAALGLARPEFPDNKGASRGVMALSVVLVAFTMVASVATG